MLLFSITCSKIVFLCFHSYERKIVIVKIIKNFPGGPVVNTPCFQYKGHSFDPWSVKKDLKVPVVWPKKFF